MTADLEGFSSTFMVSLAASSLQKNQPGYCAPNICGDLPNFATSWTAAREFFATVHVLCTAPHRSSQGMTSFQKMSSLHQCHPFKPLTSLFALPGETNTGENNGALKVIPGSHAKGIFSPDTIDTENEYACVVDKGGIMVMRPLLMHASGRTINNKNRRVIHIEFSKALLPQPLQWSEALQIISR